MPQAHQILTYTIDEHPNPEACFDYMRANWDLAEGRTDEALATLKGFCDYFNLDLKNYSISALPDRGEDITLIIPGDLEELSGARLWKYIAKNFSTYRCQYTGKIKPTLGGDCPFTGMCYDESMLDPIREFMAKPDSRDWQELVDDCTHALLNALHADGEFDYSDEGLKESAQCNEYQFTKDGEIY